MTRAAVSIASNIAEEAERDSRAKYIRFIHIAQRVLPPNCVPVYIAQRIGILSDPQTEELTAELKEISSMLQGLSKSLKSQIPCH